MTARPLTKSRFKLALACPTQLYYAADRDYSDRNADNDFLQALADGGYQVGELAKFLYDADPVASSITVDSLDYAEALAETAARLAPAFAPGAATPVVIAEAALASGDLLVRVDILRADPTNRVLEVSEVKSKSVDSDTVERGFRADSGYESIWQPYLYDIAFQTLVAERMLEALGLIGWRVRSTLVLVNKEAVARLDGVHQNFAITGLWNRQRRRYRIQVQTPSGLTADSLDLGLLRPVDVTAIVADLKHRPVPSPHAPEDKRSSLETFVDWATGLQLGGQRYFGAVSKVCKKCPYRASPRDDGLSGVNECFDLAVRSGILATTRDVSDPATPLSIDLWGGRAGARSMADRVLAAGRAALVDIRVEDINPRRINQDEPGMHALDRRLAQIATAQKGGAAFKLDHAALAEMDQWEWPLHMIDFETTAPAIPFFAGMHPYQLVAFQFSHHIMERDGDGIRIRHANQWISTRTGHDPSIEFVRALRSALMPDGELLGTVFRYHNHENTVLRGLRAWLARPDNAQPDSEELIDFIDHITHSTKKELEQHIGAKDMVDLHSLARRGYVSRHAGGSISLKHVLPAILHDAPDVAQRYSKPGVYGAGLSIPSKNDWGPNGQVWLTPQCGGDPYRNLPPVFGPDFGPLDDMLFRLMEGDDDEDGPSISQGGVAMMAYNYTQFARLGDAERLGIEQALLRYCELDTLAMVILVEGLSELRGGAFGPNA
jgi:hypothetical protein